MEESDRLAARVSHMTCPLGLESGRYGAGEETKPSSIVLFVESRRLISCGTRVLINDRGRDSRKDAFLGPTRS